MRNYWLWSILVGIVIVIAGVIEYVGKITVIHAVAILTVIVGVSVALGGAGTRQGPTV